MKILFIGESWTIHMIHSKGFDSFTSTKYEEGASYLLHCLRDADIEVDYLPTHEVQVRFSEQTGDLQKYDAIVISDIGSNTFLLQNSTFYEMKAVPNALTLIQKYVGNGGGLLMIGGYLSFTGIEAKANYKNTVLEKVLPVIMKDCDDRVERPEGVYPKTTDVKHSITDGLGEWPAFLGYNQFTAKPDATVLAETDSDPFLVVSEYGKGKTACFASDCAPHWGSKGFMEWGNYQQLWTNILKYLAS